MICGDPIGQVRADSGYVWQVLMNLVVNARDAMPEGGDLAISVRELPITRDPDLPAGRYVEIRSTDTGTGMPAADPWAYFAPAVARISLATFSSSRPVVGCP